MELKPLATLPSTGRLAIDSAPIIYVLEDHPDFAGHYVPIFNHAEAGHYEIVVSTVTLAEVLTGPLKSGRLELAEKYRQTLTRSTGWRCVDLNADIAHDAARIRADANLKLPDAVQVATAVSTHCVGLITHDRDFRSIRTMSVYAHAPEKTS